MSNLNRQIISTDKSSSNPKDFSTKDYSQKITIKKNTQKQGVLTKEILCQAQTQLNS